MKTGRSSRRRGFTLLEAILALVLASLLFASVSLYTGTWLLDWQRLVARGGQEDVVAIVLDRLVEDIEEAQPFLVSEIGGERIIFEGSADRLTFLRPALGFEARAGLDQITYHTGPVGSSMAIVRSRRNYGLPDVQGGAGEDLPLIRGAVTLAFSYAGPDGGLMPEWTDRHRLPVLVRVEISGASPRPWRQSAYARLRVEMPANCGTEAALAECLSRLQPGS